MFRSKYTEEIPTNFSSHNFGCRLTKYLLYIQNEDLLARDTKTTENRFVNRAYRNDNERKEQTSVLKNTKDHLNNGTTIAIGSDEVTTNKNANATRYTTEINREANNEFEHEVGNSVRETANTVRNDTAVAGNGGERNRVLVDDGQRHDTGICIYHRALVDDFNQINLDDDEDSFSISGPAFKRSLSFGDKPKRRKTVFLNKEQTPVSILDEEASFRSFSIGNEQSTSNDSAFSGDAWRLSLEEFTSKRQGSSRKLRRVSKQMRSYYKQQDTLIDTYSGLREQIVHRSFYKNQDKLIDQYSEIRMDIEDAMENSESVNKLRKKASNYAKATFAANVVLLIIKIVAVSLSGSVSLISSLVDSTVDLLSGLVIWVTTRAVKKTDRYVYPQGRTKLEPMSIVILAVIMSVASLQIIKESVAKMFGLYDRSQSPPVMTWVTIGIAFATVVIKLVLYLLCRRVKHPTVQVLALDHRNDVLSNFLAIVFGYIGSQQMQAEADAAGLIYIDPIGAILISIYIIANWIITGWDQIKLLIGHTASADFISKITWICLDHHKKIDKIDTVRAFHFGHNFLVEVDIAFPPDMTLKEAHDIAEPLQQKLERLPNVERAFVHADYETTHNPKCEHKVV